MIGIAGIIAFVIAAVLELVKSHVDAVIWLIILGGILVGVEATFGWYRGGRRYGGPA